MAHTLDDNHRLVVVTGKGGVGKSLLAAAVARCSAERGLATILVTLDTRDERHPIIDVPLAYTPRRTGHGFSVSRVDAFQAAAEYARRKVPFGAMYESFFKGRTFRDFAAAAPGFEELMCLGKLYNLAMESEFGRVVFDAPATGHLQDLLAVPGVTQRAVRVGPLNHNARKIEDLLLDPERTRVLIATLAEEMPVSEALETVALCRDRMRMGWGPVLVNRRVSRRFSDAEMWALADLERREALSLQARNAVGAGRAELAESDSQYDALQPLRDARIPLVEIPRIVQRRYDGDALIREAARHVAPILGPVGATSRSRMSSAHLSRPGGRSHSQQSPSHSQQSPSHSQQSPYHRQESPSHRQESFSHSQEGFSHRQEASSHSQTEQSPSHSPGIPDLRAAPLDLGALVRKHRVIICCGSGGVGKTTGAAALGVLAAQAGLKVQVMTIDPARRLAQAMGFEGLGHEPRRVPLAAPGELSAMMLDSKRAFDRLVETYAPDARVREAIFANHYYQQLSTSLGGSRELVAMERVLEVAAEDTYDLLIVDTPPSQHALDFLDAPDRIVSLLDGSMTQWLVRPYGLAARTQFNLFRQSSGVAMKFLERFTGVELLADLSDFLLAFSSMFEGFKERSHRVQALMRDPGTAFLLVCAPESASLVQVGQFAERLDRDRMHIAGLLANRVHPAPGDRNAAAAELSLSEAERTTLAEAGDAAFSPSLLWQRLAEVWRDAMDLHLADHAALAATQRRALPLHMVPRLSHDLHSMADLESFAGLLRPAPAEAAGDGDRGG